MKFIKSVFPVILFFIFGDVATTLYALQLPGLCETNPMLQFLVCQPIIFILSKCLVLVALYFLYKGSTEGWFRVYAGIPAVAGFLLCVNNIHWIMSV
jgi:ABC-type uncharacterized transport system permease subunit